MEVAGPLGTPLGLAQQKRAQSRSLGWEDPLEEGMATHSSVRLCNPMDCSPPGSSVHEILQARTLEWLAISFSNA